MTRKKRTNREATTATVRTLTSGEVEILEIVKKILTRTTGELSESEIRELFLLLRRASSVLERTTGLVEVKACVTSARKRVGEILIGGDA